MHCNREQKKRRDKVLTHSAESIASWLQRPLLSLTVADIGTVETTIEHELMRWFDFAEAWNAVLLVDEADIFLEQRRTRDLSRNSLVSGKASNTLKSVHANNHQLS